MALNDDELQTEIDRTVTNICNGILQGSRGRRRAEIERLEAQIAAEWQRILDERNAP